jgi:DNA modification methylase
MSKPTPYHQRDGITIYCGDCTQILPHLSPNIALTFTSPPYNLRHRIRNGKYTTTEKATGFSVKYGGFDDCLPIDQYEHVHTLALQQMLGLSKTVFWNIQIVTGNKEAVFKIIGTFAQSIKDIVVWDKRGQPAMNDGVINRSYELLLILEPNATAGRALSHAHFERGTMPDVWRSGQGDTHTGNRAVFPLSLPAKAITHWSQPGDIILDPFVGTGTTLRAAQQLGRRAIGIDISEAMCQLAKEGLAQPTFFSLPSPQKTPAPTQLALIGGAGQ